MEKESMKAYLCAMKNTRVRVTGRNPLTFTVNGCEDLQEFRERLFNAQFDALGYCAGVLDGGAANAGTIRVLRAMLKGVRDTILLDKQGRPHRPLLHVEEGGEKNLRGKPPPCGRRWSLTSPSKSHRWNWCGTCWRKGCRSPTSPSASPEAAPSWCASSGRSSSRAK